MCICLYKIITVRFFFAILVLEAIVVKGTSSQSTASTISGCDAQAFANGVPLVSVAIANISAPELLPNQSASSASVNYMLGAQTITGRYLLEILLLYDLYLFSLKR